MKIKVIKKASAAKPSGFCPVYVDDNPMSAKK
jgi:hypothetical protein